MRSLLGKALFPTRTVLLALGLALSLWPALAHAQSHLDITKDKEKTVYSIGSGSQGAQEEAAEKEQAWEMLKNIRIKNDGNKPPQDRQRSSQEPNPSPSGKP
jgi:hypothetical protein